jgi:hypothetical protein
MAPHERPSLTRPFCHAVAAAPGFDRKVPRGRGNHGKQDALSVVVLGADGQVGYELVAVLRLFAAAPPAVFALLDCLMPRQQPVAPMDSPARNKPGNPSCPDLVSVAYQRRADGIPLHVRARGYAASSPRQAWSGE